MTAPTADWAGHGGTGTAERYLRFAEHAEPLSVSYAILSRGVAADPLVLDRLDELPAEKRRPNLLLGAVRWHGGLCLYPDRYAFRYDGGRVRGDSTLVLDCATEGPVPLPSALPSVVWRGRLDLDPLDVTSDEDVRWLESLIWPEETERFAILCAAVALARRDPARIVAGDLTRDLVAVAARAPSDATPVVYHSAVLAYVSEAGRAAFRAQLAQLAASRPVVWLANEAPDVVVPADQVPAADPDEFVLLRDDEPLARTGSHGTHVRWLARPGRGAARAVCLALAALVAFACPALVAFACPTLAGAANPAGSRVLFHLQDPRIDEASGIGVGVRSKGIDYVENDSGDTHRFFALDARTGATAAVITVPHATNVDWEDLQVAPDGQGRSSVWLADIGDNRADRDEIDVYRVREPRVSPHDDDLAVRSARPAIWRLRYPDGPTDAESLAVTPGGRAFVVTKSILGRSAVYELPSRPDASRVRTLTRVGTIRFQAAAGSSPVGSLGSVLATSAAISRNGRLLAVRTYVYADVWRLHPGTGADGVAAALRTTPTRVALPAQRQGEGLAIAHGRLLLDSEGVGTAVRSVPLPAALRAAATAAPVAQRSSTLPPSSTRPTRSPAPARRTGHVGGASVVVLVLLIGGVLFQARRARRHGPRRDDGRG